MDPTTKIMLSIIDGGELVEFSFFAEYFFHSHLVVSTSKTSIIIIKTIRANHTDLWNGKVNKL